MVGGSGGNKIASLLDRGNMALEDGDWAKADSFFEDVLNNDSKNAQAYLGKTLAQEKCRTIDAFARKRQNASQNARGQALSLEPQAAHIAEMVEKYSLPGYVDKNVIRKLYDFDLGYHSDVAERKQQYQNEEKYWSNHKQLSRAEKFAAGAVAENLANEKKALFAVLSDRVKKAEAAEAAAKQDVRERYDAHLKQADEKAEKLYNDALNRREKHYQELLQVAKTSCDVEKLTQTGKKFEELGAYQDSKNLAGHCRKRAAEEQAKRNAAAEAKRIAREREAAARKKKYTVIGSIVVASAVLVFLTVMVLTKVVIPGSNYDKAETMLAQGQFDQAEQIFTDLGDYRDAPAAADYAAARALLEQARSRDPEIGTILTELKIDPSSDAQQTEAIETPAEAMSWEAWGLELLVQRLESVDPEERQTMLHTEDGLRELKAYLMEEGFGEDEIESIFEMYMALYGDEETAQDPQEKFTVDISMSENDLQVLALYDYVRTLFVDMGDYRDAASLVTAIDQEKQTIADNHYNAIFAEGEAYLAAQEYEKAMAVFVALEEVMDTSDVAEETLRAQQESIQREKAEAYTEAKKLMDAGEYESAMGIFAALSGYQDSDSQRVNCMRLLAKRYEEAEDLPQAVKWYAEAQDDDNVNRVKYQYVRNHQNAQDVTTYEYLKDLKTIGYEDTEKIYASLYKIQVKVFFNNDRNDTKTNKSVIYYGTGSYGHYQVTGGPPVGTVKLRFYYETRWGYDNQAKRDWEKESDSVKEIAANGADNVFYLESGSNLYYHRITVYDAETGEQLAQAVLYRPYD